ncbi:MAG: V-type ATP synthase subunit E [Oscillospiraceae bacterium]|nr:V-type ATP synthase subunit E [Oscillospiraceae bacterium]
MKGMEKITRRISSEAEEAAAAVIAQGQKAADDIRARYEAQARETEAELLRQGREKLEQKVQRAERAAKLDAKKDILSVKQEMVSAAYEKARQLILALPEEKYVAFLARQAGAAALTGREEIILSPEDRKALGEKLLAAANAAAAKRGLPGTLKLSQETRPIRGGLVLREGDIEVNCTLESLLELSRGSLDAEVARTLFQ